MAPLQLRSELPPMLHPARSTFGPPLTRIESPELLSPIRHRLAAAPRGLAREGEACALRPFVFVINDEVVALRVAREVSVNDLRNEKVLALGV